MNINKNYLLTVGISALGMIAILIILLMIFLPKQTMVSKGNVNNYEKIQNSEYTFEATKDISSESLTKQYTITGNDMDEFKQTNQYKPGNTDPFVPIIKDKNSGTTNTDSAKKKTNTTSNE